MTPSLQYRQKLENEIVQLEHDLDVATGEGWTDKLVWIATKDTPWLISTIRTLTAENEKLHTKLRIAVEALEAIEAEGNDYDYDPESAAQKALDRIRFFKHDLPPTE